MASAKRRRSRKPATARSQLPTTAALAEAIGIPVDAWPGRYREIACKIHETGLIAGTTPRYGYYTGLIAPGSPFQRRAVARHGWLVLPDNTILDPTRWVFENVEPYLAVIKPNDYRFRDYDLAGHRLAGHHLEPPPNDSASTQIVELAVTDEDAQQYLTAVFGRTSPLNVAQVYWLAHRSPDELGKAGPGVFRALKAAGRKAMIPTDNWYAVMGEY